MAKTTIEMKSHRTGCPPFEDRVSFKNTMYHRALWGPLSEKGRCRALGLDAKPYVTDLHVLPLL